MRSVYVLLTRSKTLFSRLIHTATHADYTHSSLCVNSNLDEFFSFGRKMHPLPFPSGFVKEQLDSGYFGSHPDTPCVLLELRVNDQAYQSLCVKITQMRAYASSYRYSVLGILFLTLYIARKRPYRYFCSQFVGELLSESGAVTLPKDASLMRPIDYQHIPQLQVIYRGSIRGLYVRRSKNRSKKP